MFERLSVVPIHLDLMLYALRDHQTIDAVGCQVLHVAVEQTGALPIEHAVSITNYSSHRRSCSCQRDFAHALWNRTQIRFSISEIGPLRNLIRIRKLRHRDFVLVWMPRPCSIHQATSFILLVLLENFHGALVQFLVGAAGKKRGHSANREGSMLMANLRHQSAEVLEECHVMRDSIS